MNRTIKIKNLQSIDDVYNGQLISASGYHTIQCEFERMSFANDEKINEHLWSSPAKILINDGTNDLTDKATGERWLKGNLEPPRSADGDWHFVNENFAHVTGNKGINWTIDKYLEPQTTYCERIMIPDDRHVTLNSLGVGSSEIPSSAVLEWYVDRGDGNMMRYNPWIRCTEAYFLKVAGDHEIGDTVFSIDNSELILNTLELNLNYEFENEDGTYFYLKIVNKDIENSTVTIESAAPIAILDNAMITLKDRPIGRIGTQQAYSNISWISPPNGFIGNGTNYFRLVISNDHDTDSGLVSSFINGWHTSTSLGD